MFYFLFYFIVCCFCFWMKLFSFFMVYLSKTTFRKTKPFFLSAFLFSEAELRTEALNIKSKQASWFSFQSFYQQGTKKHDPDKQKPAKQFVLCRFYPNSSSAARFSEHCWTALPSTGGNRNYNDAETQWLFLIKSSLIHNKAAKIWQIKTYFLFRSQWTKLFFILKDK